MRRSTKDIEKQAIKKRNILIDFIGMNSEAKYAHNLKHKLDKNPINTSQIISATDFSNNQGWVNDLANPKDIVQFYISAHSSQLREQLSNSKNTEKLIENIANCIGNNKAIINIVACSAGRGQKSQLEDNGADSLAAQLHYSLTTKTKRDIPVIARTQDMTIYKNPENKGQKVTVSLDLSSDEISRRQRANEKYPLLSKQPGSKVIYQNDSKGHQIRMDAYTHKWKITALHTLKQLANNTPVQQKKAFLLSWLHDFQKKKPKEIFDIMCNEIANNDSVLKKYAPYSLAFLYKNPESFTQINKLIKEAQPYFDSKYTVNDYIDTGHSVPKS